MHSVFLMPYEQCGFGGVVRRRGDAIYALNGCDPDDFRFVLSIIAEHSRQVKISGYSIAQWVKKCGTTFVHRVRCLIFAE